MNCSPILDDGGKRRGVLVTYDDVTEVEKKNARLHEMVEKVQNSEQKIRRKNAELHHLATRDALTGCFNRRSLFEAFEQLFADAKQAGQALSCLMVDIDHFKSVNDTYGHAIGDKAIQFMADTLTQNSRGDDIVGRYGGEEFCILFPGQDLDRAKAIAERMRGAVERGPEGSIVADLNITASFGVATLEEGAEDPETLVDQADQALYRAKSGGRNRVICWSEASVVEDEDAQTNIVQLPVTPCDRQDDGHGQPLSFLSREAFFDRITQALSEANPRDSRVAVLSVQLHGVQGSIQGSQQPNAGAVLATIGERLEKVLQTSEMMSCLGRDEPRPVISYLGDGEFGVLLTELADTSCVSRVVKRIVERLSTDVQYKGQVAYRSIAVGISIYPNDGEEAETLLQNATSKLLIQHSLTASS